MTVVGEIPIKTKRGKAMNQKSEITNRDRSTILCGVIYLKAIANEAENLNFSSPDLDEEAFRSIARELEKIIGYHPKAH